MQTLELTEGIVPVTKVVADKTRADNVHLVSLKSADNTLICAYSACNCDLAGSELEYELEANEVLIGCYGKYASDRFSTFGFIVKTTSN